MKGKTYDFIIYYINYDLWNLLYTQIKYAKDIVELVRWRQNLWIKRANFLYKNVQEMFIQTVMKDSIETTENFFAVNFDTCCDLLITIIRYFLYWTSALFQFCWKIESPIFELFEKFEKKLVSNRRCFKYFTDSMIFCPEKHIV